MAMVLRDSRGAKEQFRWTHHVRWTAEIANQARAAIGMCIEGLQYTNMLSEKLAKVTINDDDWVEYMTKLMDGKENVFNERGVLQPTCEEIWTAMTTSPGHDLKSADGTMWGAVNGVTHWVDHVRGKTDDGRSAGGAVRRRQPAQVGAAPWPWPWKWRVSPNRGTYARNWTKLRRVEYMAKFGRKYRRRLTARLMDQLDRCRDDEARLLLLLGCGTLRRKTYERAY